MRFSTSVGCKLAFMRRFLKQLFCKHESLNFVRNIYGDEINAVSVTKIYRSWWECSNCGKWIPKPELMPEGKHAA